MNIEKQRIAIAEACGFVSKDKWGSLYKTPRGILRDCPDYLNDLNAMHEAEKILIRPSLYAKGGWGMYLRHLSIVTDEQHPIDATAAQRAEAFLKTLNLWTK